MSLRTIQELLTGDPDEIATAIEKVSCLSVYYEKHIDADNGDGHLRAPGIHASEVSGCSRRIVYSILGEQRVEKSAPIWKKRFKMGHKIHDMIQTDLEGMAAGSGGLITFEREVRVHPCMEQPLAAQWDIHSSTDGRFTIKEEVGGPVTARALLEIKSASPDEYEKLKGPKPEHIEQAHVYMACLDIPLIWFVYYNKGNQNYTPSTDPNFLIRFNPKLWEKLEERFEKAHTAAALKQLPDREEGIQCSFCAFSHTCNPTTLNLQGRPHKSHARWRR